MIADDGKGRQRQRGGLRCAGGTKRRWNGARTNGRDGAARGQAQGLQSDHSAHQQPLLPERQGRPLRRLLSPSARSRAPATPTLLVSPSPHRRIRNSRAILFFFFLPSEPSEIIRQVERPLSRGSSRAPTGEIKFDRFSFRRSFIAAPAGRQSYIEESSLQVAAATATLYDAPEVIE